MTVFKDEQMLAVMNQSVSGMSAESVDVPDLEKEPSPAETNKWE